VESRPLGNGLIHRTVLARYETRSGPQQLVHQRINSDVFRKPASLMENLERITRHLQKATPATPHSRFLQLRPTLRGELVYRDEAGHLWRSFVYLDGTRSLNAVNRIDQAREAAHAFGHFAAVLADLPAPPLHETIPRFHDMRGRIEALDSAIASDPLRRVPAATRELADLRNLLDRQEAVFGFADWANLPRRIAHHDCKLNNVLFDASAIHAVCATRLR
ncbi:MAG: phosphotransferase, partial [Pirellulales bacterium]